MQGARAYILPGVAALVLLGYWLLVPSADQGPAPSPSDTPTDGPAPADTKRAERLRSIIDAVGPDAAPLPDEYANRQLGIVRGAVQGCDLPDPAPFRVTLVGAPGAGGAVESVDADAEASAPMNECVRQAAAALELAAPAVAGRSVLDL